MSEFRKFGSEIGSKKLTKKRPLHYWSHRFGVSPEELKRAVSKAGVMADEVARALGKSWLLNIRTPPNDVA